MKKTVILLCALMMSAVAAEAPAWNGTNQFSGWKARKNVKCETTADVLVLTEIGNDPQLVLSGIALDPAPYRAFTYRYRAEGTGKARGQLYYAHDKENFSDRQKWMLPSLEADGKWHTVTVTEKSLTNPASWFEGGLITQLRFDPTDSAGGKIEFSEIRFAAGAAPLPSLASKLDAPEWPAVKAEFLTLSGPVVKGAYFQGKMIKSPKDKIVDGKHSNFFLRRNFTLKAKPVQGWLSYTADDGAEAFVNGVSVANARNWQKTLFIEVSDILTTGKNVLAFHYRNTRSPGGVMGELFVKYADDTFERINTDESFISSVEGTTDWNKIGFDDSNWEPIVGQPGPPANPWVDKLDYRDFSKPQKLVHASALPAAVEAGNKTRLRFDFEGQMPELPFHATVKLKKGEFLLWSEELTLDQEAIRSIGNGQWQIDFHYELPLYLNSVKAVLHLETAFFYKAGGFPEVKIEINRVKSIPGYETVPVSTVEKTAYGPTFMLNGKPFFPVWGGVTQRARPDRMPRHSDAPLNLVTVYNVPYEWWPECGKFDPSSFDRQAELYRRQNKDAYYMWDLSIYPPRDWAKKYTDEMCTDDQGNINRDGGLSRTNYSFASQQALRDMEEMMLKAIDYLENSPYANRIIGYRINGGHTIEWLGWNPAPNRMVDFSPAARKAFEKFAVKSYPQLKDFSIPTLEERRQLDNGELLWEVPKHLKSIAYHDFYSNAVADMLIALTAKAKEYLGRKKVVGTYYGYTMTLHASGRSQMRAHYALKKVLDSGAVDFLMSPQPYRVRNIGDTMGDMKPFQTLVENNIIPVIEDDTRTHNAPGGLGYFQMPSEKTTIDVMRRNMGFTLCRNQPAYYYAIEGTNFDFSAMARDIATVRKVGEHCLAKQVRRNSEIALVVSEETIKSMPMLTQGALSGELSQAYMPDGSVQQSKRGGTVLTHESFEENYTRFARLGAPADYLLAEDIGNHPGNYKLYVFINCFQYDEAFLKAVDDLRKRDCVLLWIYAPGYTFNGVNGTENMTRLTGINLAKSPQPLTSAVKLADGRLMGPAAARVAPMFCVTGNPEVIGTYENGAAGIAAVKTGQALSVFSGVWQFDVPFLNALAERAGVHIYSESSDPVEANASLFALHARFPGTKTIRIPRKTDVLDVFARRIVARQSDSFTFEAPLHSSHLFYYGDDAGEVLADLLKNYEKETK